MQVTYRHLVNALYDIRVFCNIINFKGGWKNFSPELHNELAAFLTAPQRGGGKEFRKRLVLFPRGHLKSTMTVLYVLWRIYRNPNIRFQICSDDKELARKFLREMCFYLENTELQRTVWHCRPHIQGNLVPVIDAQGRRERLSDRSLYYEQISEKVVWNQEMIYVIRPVVLKEPTVAVLSVEQTGTGEHYDFLLLDDIVNFSNSDTPKKARKIEEWVADLASVLDPSREMVVGKYQDPDTKEWIEFKENVGGEQVINGTLYFKWDYYHKIMESAERRKFKIIKKNIYKNGKNNIDGYIYPEKFNAEYEDEVREDCLTFRRFASQYLMRIVADETKTLDAELIHYIDESMWQVQDDGLIRIKVGGREKFVKPMGAVDPAISLEKDADFTACGIGGVDDELNMYVFDFMKDHVLPSTTINQLFKWVTEYNVRRFAVEGGTGFQDALYHTLRNEMITRKTLLHAIRYVPTGNKKENIAVIMEPIIQNGKLHLPYWVYKKIQDEIELFPSDGVEDDGLDFLHILAKHAFPTTHVNSKLRKAATRHVVINRRFGGCR